VIVDIARGDALHLLGTRDWALHYTFIREAIDKAQRLNLCDATQNAVFHQGWIDFSAKEYFVTEDRHYLLGTLAKHAGTQLQTLEFAVGDAINGAQMKQAFFATTKNLPDTQAWTVRPQTPGQVAAIRATEGQLPMVGPNAPFRGQTYQPLTAAIGFGVLRFVPATDLAQATLDPRTILITDDVPNDISLVGGLITESFQAPLAHVNVLSKGRGTPNMGFRNARQNPRLTPLVGKPVRIEVRADDFDIRLATAAELDEQWAKQFGGGALIEARIDKSIRKLLPLSAVGCVDLPRVGAKAAQLYLWLRDPSVLYRSRSTFSPEQPVMLNVISAHFRPLIDPQQKQPWFAMEVEFKLMLNPQDPNGAKRLVIKQTRPYSVVRPDIPADCRERL